MGSITVAEEVRSEPKRSAARLTKPKPAARLERISINDVTSPSACGDASFLRLSNEQGDSQPLRSCNMTTGLSRLCEPVTPHRTARCTRHCTARFSDLLVADQGIASGNWSSALVLTDHCSHLGHDHTRNSMLIGARSQLCNWQENPAFTKVNELGLERIVAAFVVGRLRGCSGIAFAKN